MQQLNAQKIKVSKIASSLNTLNAQLATLGIETSNLQKPQSQYLLLAHEAGTIASIIKPLHANVDANEALVTIVKNSAYYLKGFLPLDVALKVRIGDKITAMLAKERLDARVTRILPKVDPITQRVVVLASLQTVPKRIFTDVFVEARLYYGKGFTHKAVKRSALSFFQNEWVVFTPQEEGKYLPQVVEIITQDEEYIAIEGLEKEAPYVSGKSYFVKSELLKSSIGDGD